MNWVTYKTAKCELCLAECEVETESKKEDYFFDDDIVRCTRCDLKGHITIDSFDGLAKIIWDL